MDLNHRPLGYECNSNPQASRNQPTRASEISNFETSLSARLGSFRTLFTDKTRTKLLLLALLFALPAFGQTVPFTPDNGLIVIEVKINNMTYNMLFDTGAPHTIVRQLNHSGLKEARGTQHGVEFDVKVTKATMELPGIGKAQYKVLEANLDNFTQKFPQLNPDIPVDGILGQDLMQRYSSIRIDYKNHMLELVP